MDEKDYAEAMDLMDRRHDWDYLYRQLAEECAELGHAALKLVRAGKDETPVHIEDASNAYVEELADVYLMIAIARTDLTKEEKAMFERTVSNKYARMMKRLGETTPPVQESPSLTSGQPAPLESPSLTSGQPAPFNKGAKTGAKTGARTGSQKE